MIDRGEHTYTQGREGLPNMIEREIGAMSAKYLFFDIL
jgi:hypothetical protein